jgi:gliding motility-associated-like protein
MTLLSTLRLLSAVVTRPTTSGLVLRAAALLLGTVPTFAQVYSSHTISDLPQLGSSTAAWGDYNRDGYPDFIIAGTKAYGSYTTELFRNNGDGTFARYATFTPVAHGSVAWGDVNADGYLDFHLTGLTTASQRISELYINQGDETFVRHPATLEGVAYGDAALVDLDQDGDLDLFYTGANASRQNVSRYYQNQDSAFIKVDTNVPGFTYGSLDVADYNRDGRPDLLLTGLLGDGNRATYLYRNEGGAAFVRQNTVLPAVSFGQAAWGDFDHDGYPDIALSGTADGNSSVSTIYRNNQNEVFTDASAGLTAMGNSSLTWLDYDSDGYLDLYVTGLRNANAAGFLYRNQQDGTFSEVNNSGLLAVYDGSVSIADHDQDGAMDLLITGTNNRGGESQLHTNELPSTNTLPSVPGGLLATPAEDSVQLTWNPATDAETPRAGVTYQLYVGTAPGLMDVVPAPARLSNGSQTLFSGANAGYATTFTLRSLAEGRYYWGVQSVDASHQSSTFSSEASFTICYALDLGADTTVCVGDTLGLTVGQPGDQVSWRSTQGLAIDGLRSVTITLAQTDTLVASLTNALGCVLRDTLVVRTYAQPVVNVGSDTSLCANHTLLLMAGQAEDSVNWYAAQRGRLATNAPQLTYVAQQTDTMWAEVFNPSGCVAYDTVVVAVHPLPAAEAGGKRLICLGESTTLGEPAEPDFTYDWQPATSLSDVTIAQPIATPDTTTTYVLRVTNARGCVDYDTVVVLVNPPTQLDAGVDRAICRGESTILGGEPTAQEALLDYRYTWSPTTSISDASVANPTATPQQTTTYTLVTQAGDCSLDTAYVTVTVNDLPETTVSEDITIGAGEAVPLLATGGVSYAWFPSAGLSRSDVSNPTASPTVTTTYAVTVTNERGCHRDETVTVTVDNRVFIPNLFSPNGDGRNEAFKVYGAGIARLELQVFDRQGNRVFFSRNVAEIMESGWDGTQRGAPLPSGSYRWMIRGQFYDGKTVTYEGRQSGKVSLVR